MAVNVTNFVGPPPDIYGAQGDFTIDNPNKFIWGPKGATSWAGTAQSFGGPPGQPGPANFLPSMSSSGNIFGPSACFNGQTMGTVTTAANAIFFSPGTNMPNMFVPPVNCYLTGLNVTNYGATGATVYFYLQDLTTNTAVFGYNAGNGIASGTIVGVSYGATTYPLIAGHQYQWQGIRGSAGATTMQINPIYSYPSGSPAALSIFMPFTVQTSTTVAKGASMTLVAPGIPSQTGYLKLGVPSYLYSAELLIAGSGVCDPFFYNGTAGANGPDLYYGNNNQYLTLNSTLTRYSLGPWTPSLFPFAANSYYTCGLYAPSGSLTVTQALVQITLGM